MIHVTHLLIISQSCDIVAHRWVISREYEDVKDYVLIIILVVQSFLNVFCENNLQWRIFNNLFFLLK